jgi:hypothetical protein
LIDKVNHIERSRNQNTDINALKIIEQMESILHSTGTVQTIHLLNCCRVLTRVIPFIFESPECSNWEETFFWSPRLIEKNAPPPTTTSTIDQKQQTQYQKLPPRGEVLISRKVVGDPTHELIN